MALTPINFGTNKKADEVIAPSVITSRAASKHFDNIRMQHADLLIGMANQKIKVDQYNQQKATEQQNKQTMQTEMDKFKMTNDTTVQKNAMDFATKQGELDIKRAALAAT